MKRHIIITGMGRTGTAWTAAMLDANTPPQVIAEHEPFAPVADCPLLGWHERTQDAQIAIAVDSYARVRLQELDEALNPTWAMLWRDPVDLVRSAMTRETFRAFHTGWRHDLAVRSTARLIFGELEATLSAMADARITPLHISSERIFTPRGFAWSAGALGVPLVDEVQMLPKRNASRGERPDVAKLEREIEWLVESLPRVAGAYLEASFAGR